ncbi:protein-glutamate O-methyltransferase CheR [Fodinisporobacter ferrooxydans]|uniref:protein-glutamate O-methyltransferase n=1 Tax=Fodinisporobacter ferrooxydans TaxID=2901836 RepID=A0ABY4CH31_9BACL|nr:protein-glutamate O-methyltransferase CheR [Alicyclobacillaceae bacterium MYW30-H2]
MSTQDFDHFMDKVLQKTGIDLRKYKRPQMERRLTALRDKRGFQDFDSYFQFITDNPVMFDEFLDRMTINVSEFFRNANRWDVLNARIIPELLAHRKKLRIWSAACSTGEEPYTLAILLQQHGVLGQSYILATDIDASALKRAQLGIYEAKSMQEMPQDIVRNYFQKYDATQFQIAPEIRKAVTFRKQNLLSDSFENDFDLIICRNVIIYFTDDAKHVLYQKFSKSLRNGGVLFVGSTEQIFNPAAYHLKMYDTFFYMKDR